MTIRLKGIGILAMIVLAAAALAVSAGCGRGNSPTPTPSPTPTTGLVQPSPSATPLTTAGGQTAVESLSPVVWTTPSPVTVTDTVTVTAVPSTPTETVVQSPSPVTSTPVTPTATALVAVRASRTQVRVGEVVEVVVAVEGVAGLYAVDIKLGFDPAMLQVQDSDPKKAGMQMKPGDFLDPGRAWLFQNVADNEAGQAWFVTTLLNPAPAVSGSGILFSIAFEGKAAGTARLRLDGVQLVSLVEGKVGNIDATTREASIEVLP